MSDSNAIRAVTERLRSVVANALGNSATVSALPLDRLGAAPPGTRLNVCLFQILPNSSWRNSGLPWKPGDERIPLALDLRYLLTAFPSTAPVQPLQPQEDIGLGMRALHDSPVLNPGGAAVAPFERARVTMHPLSLDDMEKLWAGVTGPRLLSVAYEVSVVLIESDVPAKMALPVLSRGASDTIDVEAGLFPAIDRIEIGSMPFDVWARSRSRPTRSAAQLDDDLFLYGNALSLAVKAEIVSLRFPPREGEEPVAIDVFSAERGAVRVRLDPIQLVDIPAGLCSIRLRLQRSDGGTYTTNSIPFALAPKVDPLNASPVPAGGTLTVSCKPKFAAGQRASLIIGGMEVASTPGGASESRAFALTGLKARAEPYPACLRVDGVDSIMVDLTEVPGTQRPTFSDACMVRVQ